MASLARQCQRAWHHLRPHTATVTCISSSTCSLRPQLNVLLHHSPLVQLGNLPTVSCTQMLAARVNSTVAGAADGYDPSKQHVDPMHIFDMIDAEGCGSISKAAFTAVMDDMAVSTANALVGATVSADMPLMHRLALAASPADVFNAIDVDGDGVIGRDEFELAMEQLSFAAIDALAGHVTNQHQQQQQQQPQQRNSQPKQQSQQRSLQEETQRLAALDSITAVFNAMDLDGNGYIDRDEFALGMEQMSFLAIGALVSHVNGKAGQVEKVLETPSLATRLAAKADPVRLFDTIDIDGNNTISLAEFQNALLELSAPALEQMREDLEQCAEYI